VLGAEADGERDEILAVGGLAELIMEGGVGQDELAESLQVCGGQFHVFLLPRFSAGFTVFFCREKLTEG
jgi:hypothetical protein